MRQTIYITKYALTQGILEFDGEMHLSGRYWVIYHSDFVDGSAIIMFKNGFTTKESAIERCEQMRDVEIKALTKKLEKLKLMTWR